MPASNFVFTKGSESCLNPDCSQTRGKISLQKVSDIFKEAKYLKINVKLKIIFGATITINFLVYNIVALNLDPIIKLYDLFDK